MMKRWLAITIGAIVVVPTVYWLAYQAPLWLAHDPKEADTVRGQLNQLISVATAAALAIYGIRKFNLELDKRRTDTFATAIDHLGSDNVFLRAGGASELGRMMDHSDRDRARALERFADFLRVQAGPDSRPNIDEPPRADIAAVLAEIRRHRYSAQEPPLDLRGIRIPNGNLSEAPLLRANLTNADLTGANLSGARLTEANLTGAALTRADLADTDLHGAHVRDVLLISATLTGANLAGTDFTGAEMSHCDLRGVDLTHAIGITTEQLASAQTDHRTHLPANITNAR